MSFFDDQMEGVLPTQPPTVSKFVPPPPPTKPSDVPLPQMKRIRKLQEPRQATSRQFRAPKEEDSDGSEYEIRRRIYTGKRRVVIIKDSNLLYEGENF